MEVIRKEAEIVHQYVESAKIEDIVAFLRKVPLGQKMCRKELAIFYFVQKMKNELRESSDTLLNETKEILELFPYFDKLDVYNRLEAIFNIPNRKDIVVYQIIQQKKDLLTTILPQGYSLKCLKRKSTEALPDDNYKDAKRVIKLVKVNDVYEVQKETVSDTSIVAENDNNVLNKSQEEFTRVLDTADTCINANTNSLPDHDSQKTIIYPIIDEDIDFLQCCPPNNVNTKIIVDNQNQEVSLQSAVVTPYIEDFTIQPSTSKASDVSSNMAARGQYDLVRHLSDITGEPKARVKVICDFHKIPLNERVPHTTLKRLIKAIQNRVGYRENHYSDSSDSEDFDMFMHGTRFLDQNGNGSNNMDDNHFDKRGKRSMLQKRQKFNEDLRTMNNSSILEVSDDDLEVTVIEPKKNSTENETAIAVVTPCTDLTFQPSISKASDMPNNMAAKEPSPTLPSSSISLTLPTNEVSTASVHTVPSEENINLDQQLFRKIMEIFSDICPNYLKRMCRGKTMSEDFEIILNTLINLSGDYPKREINEENENPELDMERQLEILKDFLPDADPIYLERECQKFSSHNDLTAFVSEAMEQRNYPTMKEYLRTQQLSAQQRQYTTEFDVKNFVKLFPDPKAVFEDPKRQIRVNGSEHYLQVFLRNAFPRLAIRHIQTVLSKTNYNLRDCIKECEKLMSDQNLVMKSKRKLSPMPQNEQNIPLLQEIAYYQHKDEILDYLKLIKDEKELEKQQAKQAGLLETCGCCFDDEILPKEILTCTNGCRFCQDCIKKSVEVAFGDGKITFTCLSNCSAEFSLQTLQSAVSPKLFSKLAQKKALAEVKAAGIEDLESCPFCDFANIINNQEDKIFRCLNPDCMKESCRLCKEPSHIPLKCDEVEKDEAVKARTYVEDKMTEALLRKCYKCGTKFFKEEGCNKMTCSCGAKMCYICGKAVTDYKHFNGIGGDRYDLCPLYSDNNALNAQNVLKGAQEAKALVKDQLKIDPTADINKHFEDRKRKLPVEPHLQHLQNQRHHIRAVQNALLQPDMGRFRTLERNELHRFINFMNARGEQTQQWIQNLQRLPRRH